MTLTTTTTTTLDELDFEPALPCEHDRHGQEHADEPASFFIRLRCPRCDTPSGYLICRSGVSVLSAHGVMHYGSCRFTAPLALALVSLTPLA